ncbi:MAG: hypothetical protein KJ583_05655 [Nanoarchaeota archaeon]|nr:hypothetical protein [Nanoarchaeota archaeon]MBU1269427.1 hypothetical protein [Nanoarchaeota archaeon]MBU1604775.1 hypothetical protein [Nanoarchaeota archaeon]
MKTTKSSLLLSILLVVSLIAGCTNLTPEQRAVATDIYKMFERQSSNVLLSARTIPASELSSISFEEKCAKISKTRPDIEECLAKISADQLSSMSKEELELLKDECTKISEQGVSMTPDIKDYYLITLVAEEFKCPDTDEAVEEFSAYLFWDTDKKEFVCEYSEPDQREICRKESTLQNMCKTEPFECLDDFFADDTSLSFTMKNTLDYPPNYVKIYTDGSCADEFVGSFEESDTLKVLFTDCNLAAYLERRGGYTIALSMEYENKDGEIITAETTDGQANQVIYVP